MSCNPQEDEAAEEEEEEDDDDDEGEEDDEEEEEEEGEPEFRHRNLGIQTSPRLTFLCFIK
jgi:hypothetical protein